MRNGAQVALLDGAEDLEVVGESYYQPNLWHLARAHPGKQRVRENICAVLVAEDDNPYDPDAVAVWIDGLKVGHLSRENAQRYRPGLLAQQEAQGMPIALPGVITGGGIRSDGPGKLGVFLHHDPEDFDLPRHPLPPPPESRMRTGLSDAFATDAADDSYDLAWMSGLPSDDVRAIPYLRKLLAQEKDILDRHFMLCADIQRDDGGVVGREDVGGRERPRRGVPAGPWCSCWRCGGQSDVTSVAAARALDSSTMALRLA